MAFQLHEQFTAFCNQHCSLIEFKGVPLTDDGSPYGKSQFNVAHPTASYLKGLETRFNTHAFWVRPKRACSSHVLPVVGLGLIDDIQLSPAKALISTSCGKQYAWVVVGHLLSRRGMTRAFFWLRQVHGLPNLIPEGKCSYAQLEEIAMGQQWMPLPGSMAVDQSAVSCRYIGIVPTSLPDNPFDLVSRLEEVNPTVVQALLTKEEQMEFIPNRWGYNAKKVREMAFAEACYHLAAGAGNQHLAIRAVTDQLVDECQKYSSNPSLADRTARQIVASAVRVHPHLG